jgi:hypothetical protein
LNLGGRILQALAFAAVVALCIYAGLSAGMIVGVIQGGEVMDATPTRSIGMAPDLTGLVEGAFTFGSEALIGVGAGLGPVTFEQLPGVRDGVGGGRGCAAQSQRAGQGRREQVAGVRV